MVAPDLGKLHRDKLALWLLVLVLLAAALFISLVVGVAIGSTNISPGTVFGVFTGSVTDKTIVSIVMDIRLPRVVLGAVVGAALAIAGVAMQGVFRNPMASPSILGISAGAAFGASLAIVLGLSVLSGSFAVPIMSFIFCLGTMLLVYGISRTGGIVPVETLLLAGIAVGSLFAALVSFMQYVAGEKLASIVIWLMGGLGGASWNQVLIATPLVIAGSLLMSLYARDLNLMTIGEEHASSLGVDTQKVILVLMVATSVVVAAAVSFSGIIGFVGLIIPHMIRMMVGPDHRILMPASILAGASFMIVTDAFARVVMAPAELPVGIVTAMLGAPFFLYLLRRRRHMMGW
ncbi:MAG TPA: iron chelate uptake ABC transporter family permease subunit [Methanomassiliicoccales archaeon]|nr:iron chelate uptake ABC transporter family permease subunit [Methanomassiliicoccales archaeon]